MNSRSKRASRWLLSAAVVAGAMLLATIATDTEPASAFSTAIHERITRNAFPFMTDHVLKTIVDGNEDEDQGREKDLAERHAQNCRFSDSADYANMRYQQVVDALREPQANDPDRAARLFGHLLHGIQDFYSHSNWISTAPEGLRIRGRLFDSGLSLWALPKPYSKFFDDVVLVEGDPPDGVSIRLPADANGRVSSAVPIVLDRRIFAQPQPSASVSGQRFRGLMTSAAPRPGDKPGDQRCPPVAANCNIATPENVCLRHGEKRNAGTNARSFDGVGRMNLDGEGGGDWFDARHVARLQTRHEWCRLLHLSRDLDPTFVAAGRLLGTWVKTDSGAITPHIQGTPCARGSARRHLVEISATPGANAPQSVPFVVFRSDFTSSARTVVARQTTKTLRICGNTNENIVATLVPPRTRGVTHVVTVPATAQSLMVRDHRGEFVVSFAIKVTPNIC
ncbi:MAG: hypothetical protein LC794_08930 [Acidobacteria bacterium]|nr:hypothetical protein [Acidobacteriota bacterium]